MEGRIRPNIYDKRLGLPTDRKIYYRLKLLQIKIGKMIHLASSAQKRTIQLQRCTRCPIQRGKWGGGPVKDKKRSFSLPCLRQVPNFYDTHSFLFSLRISNFQLPTIVEVNFLAQILLLPQMQSAHFQKSGNKQGNFREHKNPHPSPVPSIQSWGVCCFLKVARTAAQHCIEGMGG